MLQLDERIDDQRLMQFSSQLSAAPKDQIGMLNELIVGDKSHDFYLGLCAGLASSYQILETDNARNLIGLCLAAASKHVLENT